MTRLVTAAVLLAGLLATIWWLPWWATLVAAAIVAALAAGELAGLSAAAGVPASASVLAIGAAVTTLAFALDAAGVPFQYDGALAASLVGALVAAGAVALSQATPSPAVLTSAGIAALAPLYLGIPLGATAWLRAAEGPAALTWLLVVVTVSDSAQYFAGRAFGRRRLAPVISPGKTVEGAVGGLAAAALAAGFTSVWLLPGLSPPAATVLGGVLAASGLVGDLFESLLKRSAGVKDSSSILPGHGGVLDRIDSYLFAAPVCFLVLRFTP